jgi:hypothetical protein
MNQKILKMSAIIEFLDHGFLEKVDCVYKEGHVGVWEDDLVAFAKQQFPNAFLEKMGEDGGDNILELINFTLYLEPEDEDSEKVISGDLYGGNFLVIYSEHVKNISIENTQFNW